MSWQEDMMRAVELMQQNRRFRRPYEKFTRTVVAQTSQAKEAGRLYTQEEVFERIGYHPFPWQWEFHRAARRADTPGGPLFIGLGGARGPGKTYAVLAQAGGDDALSFPGLSILYLRKTERALKVTFTQKLYEVLPEDRAGYKFLPSEGIMLYQNGSVAHIMHFQSESDIAIHQGQQWDVIVIEEASTLSDSKLEFLKTCLRTTKPNWRPRMYLTWNWGGVSHAYLKRLFYDRRYRSREKPEHYLFFGATVDDNPLIKEIDPEYVEILDSLTGWMYEVYRRGNPNVLAGTFFVNWNPADVVIASRAEVPPSWRMWASMDYGYGHRNVWQFHALDDEGNIHTVREVTHHRADIPTIASEVFTLPEAPRIEFVATGMDTFDVSRTRGEPSIARQYEIEARRYGLSVRFIPAQGSRVSGWALMLRRLGGRLTCSYCGGRNSATCAECNGNGWIYRKPTWFIWDRCQALLDWIPTAVHDPKNPDDILKQDVDPETGMGGDDSGDAARYGLVTAPVVEYIEPMGFGHGFDISGIDLSIMGWRPQRRRF